MKNKKKRKTLLLVLLLLGISIGFAALSTTLKIIGTTNISKNTWNIYWENKSVNQNGVSTTAPTLSAEQGKTANTIATWSVTLNLPGDFYEFTINAVNSGTIDAMLSEDGITTTVVAGQGSPSTLPEYIVYTVTYEDGTAIAPYHLLAKATGGVPTKEAYKVRVEFTDDITVEQMNNIPSGGYSYTFTTQATYVQADDNAIDLHPPVNPYLTRFDDNYVAYSWDTNTLSVDGYTKFAVDPTTIEYDDVMDPNEYDECDDYEYEYIDGKCYLGYNPICPNHFDDYDYSIGKCVHNGDWYTSLNPQAKVYARTTSSIPEVCGVFNNGTVCMTSSYYNSDYSSAQLYSPDFNGCGKETYDGTGETCLKGYVKTKADEMLSKGATSCSINSSHVYCTTDGSKECNETEEGICAHIDAIGNASFYYTDNENDIENVSLNPDGSGYTPWY